MATNTFAENFLAVDYYTRQIDPKTYNILVDIKQNKSVSRYKNKKTYSICRKIMEKSL
jgi:hypothetical protein